MQNTPEIATAQNAAARRRMIDRLRDDDPATRGVPRRRRHAEGEPSGAQLGPLSALWTGDVNTYSIFAETKCS